MVEKFITRTLELGLKIAPTQFINIPFDDESLTLTNLGNDHGFIIKKYFLNGMRPFGGTQSKTTRAYVQSGQYHTIMESRVHLIIPTCRNIDVSIKLKPVATSSTLSTNFYPSELNNSNQIN